MNKTTIMLAAAAIAAAAATTLDTSVFGKYVECSVAAGEYSGGTLSDFPVLVRLSNATGFDFSDFSSPADELRFADGNGESLDYEIDTWDESSGMALIWVSVPSLASSTTITAWFAPTDSSSLPAVSSTAVWTKANYIGVWHFNDADGTGHADATGHGLTATPRSTEFTPYDSGAVGQAFKANGTGAFLPSETIAG